MYLQYGSYAHAIDEAAITPISRRSILDGANRVYGTTETWEVRGWLQAPDVSSLTQAIANLENAYAVQGQDLGLFNDDGSQTAHGAFSANTLGGIRVMGIEYPDGGESDAEYTTYRKYTIRLEWDTRVAANGIIAWTESILYTGGGYLMGFLEPILGLPQKQQFKQSTTFRAVQRGTAVGLWDYPPVPPPIWPGDLEKGAPEINPKDPRRAGNQFTEFQVSWAWFFAFILPPSGLPTRWPDL
jgi:hypothetical protein